ncbi:hypothetical protein ILUMI_07351, partial [Ignelater luminosus]
EKSGDKNKITYAEIRNEMKSLKLEKAPGCDEIYSKILKYMSEKAIQVFIEILNIAWKEEKVKLQFYLHIRARKHENKSKISYSKKGVKTNLIQVAKSMYHKTTNVIRTNKEFCTNEGGALYCLYMQ